MEEEDDDFYGGAGANAQEDEILPDHGDVEEQKMDVSVEQDDDEDDSDDVWAPDRLPMQTCVDMFYVGRTIHP